MTDVEIRFECVRLALQHRTDIPGFERDRTTQQIAEDIYKFGDGEAGNYSL